MFDPADEPAAAFAQHRQARAVVFTTLVIVGGSAQQVVRELLQALLTGLVKGFGRCAELLGIEAHVVARKQ
ncbi:hypothetical protein D3C84_1091130 [compost metagenome]